MKSVSFTTIKKHLAALRPKAANNSRAESAAPPQSAAVEDRAYEDRLKKEQEVYRDCENVHELPGIFHYWSNRYLRPKLETFGFSSPDQCFEVYAAAQCRRDLNHQNRFISIGSGNCDLEIQIANALVNAGLRNFSIECLDINASMLDRGRQNAGRSAAAAHVSFTEADFNYWKPAMTYDGVFANQALHHVLELENLFDAIAKSLATDGVFVTSDMIGRNGHARWPEALDLVQEFWSTLPAKYKYNHQLRRQEEVFENWDCSGDGFEGIRAQDILPLLIERFRFRLFIAFANIVDPFIDRSFGHNFNIEVEADRVFVDRLHERDEQEIQAGRIKPTHMIAVLGKTVSEMKYYPPLTPEFCVRKTAG